jgi:superfamily II DNA helicase RecQ
MIFRLNPTIIYRPNIFLEVMQPIERFSELEWIAEEIRDKGQLANKTSIYTENAHAATRLHLWLRECLGGSAYVGGNKALENRMVELYHRSTDTESKDDIIDIFCKQGSVIRLLISTLAFGLGVDIPDVRFVVLWGVPSSDLTLWQLIGRCGRDELGAVAVIYAYKASCNRYKGSIRFDEGCIRKQMMENFLIEDQADDSNSKPESAPCDGSHGLSPCTCVRCRCCSICFKTCKCENKKMPRQSLLES